jgi:hypothetical protein
LPHEPQFASLFSVSTHCPLHEVNCGTQPHALFWQISPCPQAVPHAPQFCRSTEVFTHAPLQSVVGVGH